MKVDNKRNCVYARVAMFTMCLFILPILFIVSTFWGLILFSMVLMFSGLGILIKSTEFDNSGECLSIRQFRIFQSGYIRPKIEIPKIYLKDYSIDKAVWVYYLTILIDNGSSKKRIRIVLSGFNQFDIIKIAKILEFVRKENNHQEMRILSEPAFTNRFVNNKYSID